MESAQWKIEPERKALYYEETQKRSFVQTLIKIRNTLLLLIAFPCPNNNLRIWCHRHRGVHIGRNVYIGMFCFIDNLSPMDVYIEDNASINAGSMILTHFDPMKQYATVFQAVMAPVLIKYGAIVAVRSVILPNVSVGKFSVVSAGSVVDKSVPDYSMVKGNPAKIVAEYESLMK